MKRHAVLSGLPNCTHCGASALFPNARFCGHCGAPLGGGQSDLPQWQRPAPAKYHHVVISRIALSCPECGTPMRFGFRRVCRTCGAQLVMVPRLFHPYHMRVFVKGPSAALYELGVDLFWLAVVLGVFALIGNAHK